MQAWCEGLLQTQYRETSTVAKRSSMRSESWKVIDLMQSADRNLNRSVSMTQLNYVCKLPWDDMLKTAIQINWIKFNKGETSLTMEMLNSLLALGWQGFIIIGQCVTAPDFSQISQECCLMNQAFNSTLYLPVLRSQMDVIGICRQASPPQLSVKEDGVSTLSPGLRAYDE